jgi:pimeloyl-ACP methyl ester carboxylesterase
LPDDLIRAWTEPLITNPAIRRDLLAYCRTKFQSDQLVQNTEALANFNGDVLVLWSPDNRVMPAEHGRRLADLLPTSRYAEIPGAYVMSMLDEPEAVAREISNFLTSVVDL